MNGNSFFEIFDTRGVRIALVSALSILALFLFAQTIATATNFGRPGVPATDTITVNGSGQATLPPDVAKISFTVDHTAATVSAAQEATTEQTNKALEFVESQGVAEKDIKTLYYTINPQYAYPNPCYSGAVCPAYGGSPKVTGYQVSQTVQVSVRDLEKVGEMLSGLGKLEVQNIQGPAFALDDASAGYDAARADAINKAKKQAKVLADQLGVSLGKVVNFSESSGYSPYPMYAMGGAMDSKVASVPNVPSGENTYSATVSITYEIR